MGMYGPSVGEPGYVPYCGGCSTMLRMRRDEVKQAFVCSSCGLETRRVNGEDMFDRTAPVAAPIAQEPTGQEAEKLCKICKFYEPYGEDYVWGHCENPQVEALTTAEDETCPKWEEK